MPKASPTPKPVANAKPSKVSVPKVEMPVSAEVVDVSVPVPVPPTPRKPKKTKDAVVITKPVTEEPEKVCDPNAVVATPTSVEPFACDVQVTETFTNFFQKLQHLTLNINALKTEFRVLEKKAIRELKIAQKANAKKKRKSGNRSPSGFVKPTLISDELANFLNKPLGSEMARTEVTREINTYIRANNLQDKTNGRQINPDASLATLLKVKEDEVLTYFNLQRYMSPHFAKSGVKA
jgi:hypothetical protein